MHRDDVISIGLIAARTGVAVSAIRYYEAEGLLSSTRSPGGQRRFKRSDIRRVSFILIAQQLGFSLDEIRTRLQSLPRERTPTQSDWARISRAFQQELNNRIETLVQLRDRLDGCIGCGCLSLRKCALYNPEDGARRLGVGPRYLLGDRPVKD